MDAEHAALIIARLRANWPQTDLTRAMTDVWLDTLRDVEFEDGVEAADLCIAELDRYTFPQVAQLRDRARAIRRRREQLGQQRVLDVPPPSDEQRAANLAALYRAREIVRSARPLPRAAAVVADAPPTGTPPAPCDHDDHRYCKSGGPIRPLNSPTDPTDNP